MMAPDTRSDSRESVEDLRERIQSKRREIATYVRTACRRRQLLVRIAIFAGALATALTAAPALGGQPLADWLTTTFSLDSPSWQILCGIAAVCSLAATIATQLRKSDNDDQRVVQAQDAMAVLEELDVGLGSADLDLDDATTRYVECVRTTAFIAGTVDV